MTVSLRRTTLLAAMLIGSFVLGGGARASLALLSDSESNPSTISTAASFGSSTTSYLHNNPTPPTADTNSQPNLPMDASAPTAGTLYNYDLDRDVSPGLVLDPVASGGGSGVNESNPTLFQDWMTGVLGSSRTIDGTVTFDFWSAMKDFTSGTRGTVRVFLRDFDPSTSSYVTIASATLNVSNWQGGSGTWVNKTVTMAVSSYTVAAGHRIELKLIVRPTAADSMWFAYDTTSHPSQLTIP